jgi:hypothetical protein
MVKAEGGTNRSEVYKLISFIWNKEEFPMMEAVDHYTYVSEAR